MKIEYAILGFLSWKNMTGYDLKKVMQNSSLFYWSGNNNQIYKALMELSGEGYILCNTIHQENAPSKKEYVITQTGIAELENMAKSFDIELQDMKKDFLIQLAWSEQLQTDEILLLLQYYETKISEEIALYQEEKKRERNFPNRSSREHFIWKMLYENRVNVYQSELIWIEQMRKGLEEWK